MINRITGDADSMDMLGRILDRASMAEMIEALAIIAANRAVTSAEHWQDISRGKEWARWAHAANRLAAEADELRA